MLHVPSDWPGCCCSSVAPFDETTGIQLSTAKEPEKKLHLEVSLEVSVPASCLKQGWHPGKVAVQFWKTRGSFAQPLWGPLTVTQLSCYFFFCANRFPLLQLVMLARAIDWVKTVGFSLCIILFVILFCQAVSGFLPVCCWLLTNSRDQDHCVFTPLALNATFGFFCLLWHASFHTFGWFPLECLLTRL